MPTGIEWTEETWNPVTGCSKVSPGCANCYAETISRRFSGTGPYPDFRPWTPENAAHNVVLHPERLDQPLRWRKPRVVFVNSMSDLFHELVPDEFIFEVFAVMNVAREHTFQILTKRPERARDLLARFGRCEHGWLTHNGDNPTSYGGTGFILGEPWPLPNVWLGVSIENARHTYRADVLREIPAAARFLSCEPLLGSLYDGRSDGRPGSSRGAPEAPTIRDRQADRDGAPCACDAESDALDAEVQSDVLGAGDRNLRSGRVRQSPARLHAPLNLTGIDWVIVGGESGPGARPMHPDWAREIRDAVLDEGERRFLLASTCAAPVECAHGYDVCPICDARPAFFFKQWGAWAPGGVGDLPHTRILTAVRPDGSTVMPGFIQKSDELMVRLNKKRAGRQLDGREWNEIPERVAVPT